MDRLSKKKIYGCSLCKQRFITFRFLKKHMLTHAKVKAFACGVCHQKFESRISCERHREVHSSALPFECVLCQRRYLKKPVLRRHIINCKAKCRGRGAFRNAALQCQSHSKSPFACHICKKAFGLKKNLMLHLKIHNGGNTLCCGICEEVFITRGLLQRHLRRHSQSKPPSNKIDYKKPILRYEHTCNVCGKSYKSKYLLNRHYMLLHEGKKFVCSICKKLFRVEWSYTRHMKTHCQSSRVLLRKYKFSSNKTESFACMVCRRNFTSTDSLFDHILVHNTIQWRWDESPQLSLFDEAVGHFLPDNIRETAHITSEETVTQPVDEQFFRMPSECLDSNLPSKCLLNGTNESSDDTALESDGGRHGHVCLCCGKSFRAAAHLNYHLKNLHSDEKPYTCYLCKYKFAGNFMLLQHMKFHVKHEINDFSLRKNSLASKYLLNELNISHRYEITSSDNSSSPNFASQNVVSNYDGGFLTKGKVVDKLCNEKLKDSDETLDFIAHSPYVEETKSTRNKVDVKDHFSCAVCKRKFKAEHLLLKHHLLSHSEEKSFTCHLCKESFAAKWFLTRHMKSHLHDEKCLELESKVVCSGTDSVNQFNCAVCQNKFATTDKLFEHMHIHSTIDWKVNASHNKLQLFDEVAKQFLDSSKITKLSKGSDQNVELSTFFDSPSETFVSDQDSVAQILSCNSNVMPVPDAEPSTLSTFCDETTSDEFMEELKLDIKEEISFCGKTFQESSIDNWRNNSFFVQRGTEKRESDIMSPPIHVRHEASTSKMHFDIMEKKSLPCDAASELCISYSEVADKETEAVFKASSGSAMKETETVCKASSGSATKETEAVYKASSGSAMKETEAVCKTIIGSTLKETETVCKAISGSTLKETETVWKSILKETEAVCKAISGSNLKETEAVCKAVSGSTLKETESLCKASSGSAMKETEAVCKAIRESTLKETEAVCKASSGTNLKETEAVGKVISESTLKETETACKAISGSTLKETETVCKAISESTLKEIESLCKASSGSAMKETEAVCKAIRETTLKEIEAVGKASSGINLKETGPVCKVINEYTLKETEAMCKASSGSTLQKTEAVCKAISGSTLKETESVCEASRGSNLHLSEDLECLLSVDTKPVKTEKIIYACDVCEEQFKTDDLLKKHFLVLHSEKKSLAYHRYDKVSDNENPFTSHLKTIFKTVVLGQEEETSQHIYSKYAKRDMQMELSRCSVCEGSFTTTEAFFDHISIHSRVKWKKDESHLKMLLFDDIAKTLLPNEPEELAQSSQLMDVAVLLDKTSTVQTSLAESTVDCTTKEGLNQQPFCLDKASESIFPCAGMTKLSSDDHAMPFKGIVGLDSNDKVCKQQEILESTPCNLSCTYSSDCISNRSVYSKQLVNSNANFGHSTYSGANSGHLAVGCVDVEMQHSMSNENTNEFAFSDAESNGLLDDSHRKNPFVCCICDKRYASKGLLSSHMKFHYSLKKTFSCNSCDRLFPTKYLLNKHLETHIDRVRMRKKHTFHASKNTLSAEGRERRKTRSFSREAKSKSGAPHCGLCRTNFSCASKLLQHILLHKKIKWACGKTVDHSCFDEVTPSFLPCDGPSESSLHKSTGECSLLHHRTVDSPVSVTEDAKDLSEQVQEQPACAGKNILLCDEVPKSTSELVEHCKQVLFCSKTQNNSQLASTESSGRPLLICQDPEQSIGVASVEQFSTGEVNQQALFSSKNPSTSGAVTMTSNNIPKRSLCRGAKTCNRVGSIAIVNANPLPRSNGEHASENQIGDHVQENYTETQLSPCKLHTRCCSNPALDHSDARHCNFQKSLASVLTDITKQVFGAQNSISDIKTGLNHLSPVLKDGQSPCRRENCLEGKFQDKCNCQELKKNHCCGLECDSLPTGCEANFAQIDKTSESLLGCEISPFSVGNVNSATPSCLGKENSDVDVIFVMEVDGKIVEKGVCEKDSITTSLQKINQSLISASLSRLVTDDTTPASRHWALNILPPNFQLQPPKSEVLYASHYEYTVVEDWMSQ